MRVVVEDLEKEKKKEKEEWENYHSIIGHVNPMDYLAEAETARAGDGGGGGGGGGGEGSKKTTLMNGLV